MPITAHLVFLFIFWLAFIGIIWIPIAWLLLSAFTPKSLLDRYFKEPHFTLAETHMMREFPGSLIRTTIWGWLLLLPSVDRKRNIKDVRSYIPLWYAVALRFFIVGAILTGVVFGGLMVFLLLLPEVYSQGKPLFTIPWPD